MKYKHFIKSKKVQYSAAHMFPSALRALKTLIRISFQILTAALKALFCVSKERKKYYKSDRDNSLFVFHLFPLPFGRRKIPTHLSLDLKLPRAPILPPLPFKTAYVI